MVFTGVIKYLQWRSNFIETCIYLNHVKKAHGKNTQLQLREYSNRGPDYKTFWSAFIIIFSNKILWLLVDPLEFVCIIWLFATIFCYFKGKFKIGYLLKLWNWSCKICSRQISIPKEIGTNLRASRSLLSEKK